LIASKYQHQIQSALLPACASLLKAGASL